MNTNKLLPLMRREWLQHRFGWLLLAVLPLLLALVLTSIGQVDLGEDAVAHMGDALPAIVAMGSIAGMTALLCVVYAISSLIIVSGLARRDHGDRSVEFWLSLPTSHTQSLAAPLLVHLLLVPAAGLLVGLLGGYAVSLVLVSRVGGAGAWLALPWGDIVAASLALALRLLVGLPLALLWLSPLILLVVLLTAWFRRWGWVILAVGLGLGSWLLKMVFGSPLLSQVINGWLRHGAQAMVHAGSFQVGNSAQGLDALRQMPTWAFRDFGLAVRDLASPLLLVGLLLAAACFALLVQWRQRGAGAGG